MRRTSLVDTRLRDTKVRDYAALITVLVSAVLVVLMSAACAAPKGPTTPRPSAATGAAADGTASRAPTAHTVLAVREPPPPCTFPAAVPDRDAAIDALLSGRALDALERFSALLHARPWDLAAAYLHGASQAIAEQENEAAAAALAEVRVIALETPPRAAPVAGGSAVQAGVTPATRLSVLASKRNLITDTEDWLVANGPTEHASRAHPPAHVAASFQGHELERLFGHVDHAVAVYAGSLLVCSAEGKQPRAYQLSLPPDQQPLEIEAAQLVGDVLLVQLSYNGYAALSGGRNGYVVAFDGSSGRLRWVSPPLSANLSELVVLGDSVITGYGFTAEPDFVFNFDLRTGALLQKLPIKSGPRIFSARDRRLYVRTYDMDYVLSIEGPGASATQPAALASATATRAAQLDPGTACRVRAAAAAIDARDPGAMKRAFDDLSADRALHSMLPFVVEVAHEFVTELRERRRADLWSVPPTVVAAPPWQREVLVAPTSAPPSPAPKLVRISAQRANPVREPDTAREGQARPFFIAPIDDGRLPAGAPDVPTHYGLSALSAIIPSGEHTLLIYAGRYLVVLRGPTPLTLQRAFDLDALRSPPRADPQWKDFAGQDATYAQLVGDALYVCNGGGSYARQVFGKKGFVTAIDLATGALRWRSDPLRCNASFAVAGNHLVTGYGFTDEPDHLFLLRLSDGATVAREELDSGPDAVTLDGHRIHVEAYEHVYEYELGR